MKPLKEVVRRLIELRKQGRKMTLLAVCPNSSAVLEAAVQSAALHRSVMLFAATLNQVDRDGGYTGWTPESFVQEMQRRAARINWNGPLYPCLDHGGPWLKDNQAQFPYAKTEAEVKESLFACLHAGYALLHIDTTVDRSLPPGMAPAIEVVVDRAVSLIGAVEKERIEHQLPEIAYEVGSDEVHGGLVEFDRFREFLILLKERLDRAGLGEVWPAFLVTQVGTDLHTTRFDGEVAKRLFDLVSPYGSLIKGHYTDWVENPEMYPERGMGGANVGPEFTTVEYLALKELCARESELLAGNPGKASEFLWHLEHAVLDSGRWKKWLFPEERGLPFEELSKERREWLTQTGARYVWSQPVVRQARIRLYENLRGVISDPHAWVVRKIQQAIDRYIEAFHLTDSASLFE